MERLANRRLMRTKIFHQRERYYLKYEVPIWEKFTLSIEEAAAYFRIGENKLRRIVSENQNADFILWNGSRPQIKRKKLESVINDIHNI